MKAQPRALDGVSPLDPTLTKDTNASQNPINETLTTGLIVYVTKSKK